MAALGDVMNGEGPEGETTREKFQRVGPLRCTNAVLHIRRLKALAYATYDMKPADADHIINLLDREVRDVETAFSNPGKPVPVIRFDDDPVLVNAEGIPL